ncbi:MAG: Na+/H+ antiporter NhaA [Myxococcales bacterium]
MNQADDRPRPLPRVLADALRPVQAFFRTESASGVLLIGATVAAFLWANSPFAHAYHDLLGQTLSVGALDHALSWPLHHWINDGLMTVFFFVVGMEIKRELVVGELNTVRRAVLPAVAAAGGMLVPAALYLAFNASGPGQAGWGVPVATDIAFALGCLAVLKGRVPTSLVVFLTALAIFDDLGAILVIALFYGQSVQPVYLLAAGAVTLALLALNRLGVSRGWPYLLLGIPLWLCVLGSGIHATLAGVVLGLCIPARGPSAGERAPTGERTTIDRLEGALHPFVAFFVVPVFALANAGVDLTGLAVSGLAHPVPLGIALGLFAGKQVGIFLATLAAVKLGLSPMPAGASWRQVHGVAVLGGIGFTMSLFVGALAFQSAPALLTESKLGILLGSAASAAAGLLLLRTARKDAKPEAG